MSRDIVSWMRSSAPMYFESDLGSNMIQICIATLAWTFNWMGLSLPLDSELHSFQKKLLEEAWIQTNASTFGCDPHTRSTCYCRVFMIIHYRPPPFNSILKSIQHQLNQLQPAIQVTETKSAASYRGIWSKRAQPFRGQKCCRTDSSRNVVKSLSKLVTSIYLYSLAFKLGNHYDAVHSEMVAKAMVARRRFCPCKSQCLKTVETFERKAPKGTEVSSQTAFRGHFSPCHNSFSLQIKLIQASEANLTYKYQILSQTLPSCKGSLFAWL